MWQERPPIIVMLTNLKENKKIKCQQYWPNKESVQYGPFTVTITDQQVLADYTIRHFILTVSLLMHSLQSIMSGTKIFEGVVLLFLKTTPQVF